MAKKEKNSVTLPKAWQSVKHQRDTSQTKNNINDISSLIVGILIAILILFILLGGINQRAFVNFLFDWSKNVGNTVSSWINGANLQVTDDGIYIDPSGTKLNTQQNNQENTQQNTQQNINSENNLNSETSNSSEITNSNSLNESNSNNLTSNINSE